MGFTTNWRRIISVGMAATGAALLSGCFLSPGTFDSTLNLQRDGHFTYSYTGQIHFLALSELSDMRAGSEAIEFVAEPCYADDGYSERACTEEELAGQRELHEQMSSHSVEQSEEERAMVQAMLGGLDPSDPEAAEQFAAALERQGGWKSVRYIGDGLFEVEFAIASTLGHDFTFPVIEKLPLSNSFVMANLRDGDRVRIEAPGFAPQTSANPMMAMMAMGPLKSRQSTDGPKIPPLDGTFRIITDGTILANNTDEGPREAPGGQMLEWKVNMRTTTAPSALISLAQ